MIFIIIIQLASGLLTIAFVELFKRERFCARNAMARLLLWLRATPSTQCQPTKGHVKVTNGYCLGKHRAAVTLVEHTEMITAVAPVI